MVQELAQDQYSFPPVIGDVDLHLFNEGTHQRLDEHLGAHLTFDDSGNPGTYFAGLYNRLGTEMSGRVIENEDLVNAPNWLPLTGRKESTASWQPRLQS